MLSHSRQFVEGAVPATVSNKKLTPDNDDLRNNLSNRSSRSNDGSSSKLTIIASNNLKFLRSELTTTMQNNDVLRDHNIQVLDENGQLQRKLAKERQLTASLHETNQEWVQIEAQLKMEQQISAVNIESPAERVDGFDKEHATMSNRIKQLDILDGALNAKITSLLREKEEFEKKIETEKTVYPPL